jgi:hypothetical protein
MSHCSTDNTSCSFECPKDTWGISFYQGKIDFNTYSYQIGSYGEGELTKEQTRQLYLHMKEYYGD